MTIRQRKSRAAMIDRLNVRLSEADQRHLEAVAEHIRAAGVAEVTTSVALRAALKAAARTLAGAS